MTLPERPKPKPIEWYYPPRDPWLGVIAACWAAFFVVAAIVCLVVVLVNR